MIRPGDMVAWNRQYGERGKHWIFNSDVDDQKLGDVMTQVEDERLFIVVYVGPRVRPQHGPDRLSSRKLLVTSGNLIGWVWAAWVRRVG